MKKEVCFYGSDVNLLSGCVVYYDAFIRRKKELSPDDIEELNILSKLEEKSCFKQPFAFPYSYGFTVCCALNVYARHCERLANTCLAEKCKSLVLIVEDIQEHECD